MKHFVPGRNKRPVLLLAKQIYGRSSAWGLSHALALLAASLPAMLILVSVPLAAEIDRARQVLGADLISPEEIAKVQAMQYSDELLASANASLPPEPVLTELAKRDYVLIFGPPTLMSLLELRELFPASFYKNPELKTVWYERIASERFARNEKIGPEWLAIMKGPYPDSTGKSWNEQKAMLSGEERVPNVTELSWLAISYRTLRGATLFRGKPFVRTSSRDSRGSRIFAFQVKSDGSYGLAFSGHFDEDASPAIGLAVKHALPDE